MALRRAGTFSVTSERHETNVLYLHGEFSSSSARRLELAASPLLARSGAGLVLDLTHLESMRAALVTAINELATRAAAWRSTVTLRLPDGHLDDLSTADLDRAVAVERTRQVPVGEERMNEVRRAATVGASASSPSPGTARREGRGYIDSYGLGRQCSFTGCHTALSRYNNRDVCGVHTPDGR
jgi:hypothetical protein